MRHDYFDEYRELGRKIAFYREKRGLSQEALSELLKCSMDDIEQIEAIRLDDSYIAKSPWTNKSLDVLFAIADILEVEVMIFFLPMGEENFEQYRTDK